jgi:hypothetical protein
MEVIAKKEKFNKSSSNNVLYFLFGFGVVLIIGGIIMVIAGLFPVIVIVTILLGVFMFLIGFYYKKQIDKVFSGPTDLIILTDDTLTLNPTNAKQGTEKISDLKNVSGVNARSRYRNYPYGSLTLEFKNKVYKFSFVADVHETATRLIILKEKYKK